MNIPNKLSIARILLTPLFMLLFLLDFPLHYLAAGLVFGAAAITDLLDGYIARKQGIVTSLGKFLDPIADKILTSSAFVLYVWIGLMSPWALMLVLFREFAVTSIRLTGAECGQVIAANNWGKIKTVTQYIAILYTLAALEFNTWKSTLLTHVSVPVAVYDGAIWVAQAMIWISVGLTVAAGLQMLAVNRKLFRE